MASRGSRQRGSCARVLWSYVWSFDRLGPTVRLRPEWPHAFKARSSFAYAFFIGSHRIILDSPCHKGFFSLLALRELVWVILNTRKPREEYLFRPSADPPPRAPANCRPVLFLFIYFSVACGRLLHGTAWAGFVVWGCPGPPPCAPANGRPGLQAWFFFWFSGRWRALAKGTAWAGFYRAVLLLLGFVVSSRPSRGKPRQMATYEVPF